MIGRDVLRDVVKSPWFEWRAWMAYADGLKTCAMDEDPCVWDVWNELGTPRGYWLADHPVNVGPLLEMLRAAVGHRVAMGCGERGCWEAATWLRGDVAGWREHEADTPCQALAAALLALEERSEVRHG